MFNFDFISMVPLECIFPYNFLSAFFFRTLAPLVVVIFLIVPMQGLEPYVGARTLDSPLGFSPALACYDKPTVRAPA